MHKQENHQHFNSIKVRLKLPSPPSTDLISTGFQFHKGTIKTSHSLEVDEIDTNFNSIKVRLKLQQVEYNHQNYLISIP